MKVLVPPIKSQGIKTKLVPWIQDTIPDGFNGKWIEPFMGTGVVSFNLAPQNALMCDTNPHLISFYNAIKSQEITEQSTRVFLEAEGSVLLEKGKEHYYYIRDRFNAEFSPLDFLFLNRAGFNGMIRFNKKGQFNIPFCHKPNRFSKAYVTKIVNQIGWVSSLLKVRDFTFKVQSFEETISQAKSGDLVYCDPPYIGRHVDYFNGWDSAQEQTLYSSLAKSNSRFILSTWHHNDFRRNEYIRTLWSDFNVVTKEHFYHVGGAEKNRNPMVEALVLNYEAAKNTVSSKRSEGTPLSFNEITPA